MSNEKLKDAINKKLIKKQKSSLRKYKIIAIASMIISLIAFNATVVPSLFVISSATKSTGSLVISDDTIKVYTNENCTEILDNIEWGEIRYNETLLKTAYILNSNTYPLKLLVSTLNWQPNSTNIANILDFSCSLEGEVLQTNEGRIAEFRLTLVGLFNGTKEQSYFSFDILINGEQVIT